ncbi:hypothetical protein MAQ5080_01928 [Marinomonas aquimarina]|uniref:Uncharacterized protein n=1 Tax=Marinomonas aquimarina TaxID=295068 RepID=A0A1A8TGF0_9GAMM|nr:hypothetical protein [Marinomonas aquimarina]SBS31330.1 hypothetical protein MAQ5080_01928 [Marinomonas aquimarina]
MQFLLPNSPQLPVASNHYSDCSYEEIVNLNGNHWRKILIIIAKLCSKQDEDWRIVRDQSIWRRATLFFTVADLPLCDEWQVIVGKTFYNDLPIPATAREIKVGQHQAFIENKRIWTPYLDYRQFPNALIDALREELGRNYD